MGRQGANWSLLPLAVTARRGEDKSSQLERMDRGHHTKREQDKVRDN